MTIEELILYYHGVGYRKYLEPIHRGSNGTGYIDAGYFYNEYLKGNKHRFSGFIAFDHHDMIADDWIGKPTSNKLLNLINE